MYWKRQKERLEAPEKARGKEPKNPSPLLERILSKTVNKYYIGDDVIIDPSDQYDILQNNENHPENRQTGLLLEELKKWGFEKFYVEPGTQAAEFIWQIQWDYALEYYSKPLETRPTQVYWWAREMEPIYVFEVKL